MISLDTKIPLRKATPKSKAVVKPVTAESLLKQSRKKTETQPKQKTKKTVCIY